MADTADAWTVRRILEWTAGHLAKHGSDSPRLDAEILLATARNCRRIDLYTRYADVLTDEERTRMRDLVQRRAKAEPVAYLVGTKEFFGLEFQVSDAVLIPRPDTEVLVMEAVVRLKELPSPRVLEIGTGSGCIAITLAKRVPRVRVTAVEISPEAMEIARANAERHGVSDRVEFLQGNGYEPLADKMANDAAGGFQMVVSNPPYIPTADIAGLDPDVRLHEPHLALDGGEDGLNGLRMVSARAAEFLAPGGWLLVEIGNDQGTTGPQLLAADPRYKPARVIKDLASQPRVLMTQLADQ